jgi:hypothetical protein
MGGDMVDLFEKYLQGQQAGQAKRRQRALSENYLGAVQGDQNALAQVYSADPEAGMQAQQFQTQQRKAQRQEADDDIIRASKFYLQTKSPQAWSYIHQKFSADPRFQGMPAQIATPEDEEGSMQFANALVSSMGSGADTAKPTGVRQFEMMAQAAGYKPGTTDYQKAAQIALGAEGRASSAGIGFDTITGADGRERVIRRDPRTGAVEVFNEATNSFTPLGGAGLGQPAAPTRNDMEADVGLANEMAKAGIPPEQIDAFLMSRGQRAGGAAQMPMISANPALAVGRSKEEEAAAVTAAQEAAKLQYAGQFGQVDAQTAAAKKLAEATAEREASRAKRSSDATEMLSVLDQAEKLLPSATGSRVGSLRDLAAGSVGVTTKGAAASSQLDILAAKLVAQVPRFEGPQSNIDVQMYQQAAGDLANRNKTSGERLAALRMMRGLAQKYANAKAQQRTQSAPSGGWKIQRVP